MFLLATALVAVVTILKGWHFVGLLLVLMFVCTGVLLVLEVRRKVSLLSSRGEAIRLASIEAEKHYMGVLLRITEFVEARDPYTRGRSERIGKLTERIARQMGIDETKCSLLRIAGQLHDIGLIAVPEAILNKHERIGAEDFRSIQKHSEVSYEVLRPMHSLAEVLPAVRYHHERMNGTGYPAALAGQAIPTEARVLAVADAYDAMTHDRPHRRAVTPLAAMRELKRCCPAGYDTDSVEALAKVVHLDHLESTSGSSSAKSAELGAARAAPA